MKNHFNIKLNTNRSKVNTVSKISLKIICVPFILLIFASIAQEAYAVTESCHCVAFRLDDIQNYYLNDVQIEVINVFQKKNASLTVAVIGNYFGEDPKITNYVKEKLQKNNPTIEIANHGWNHEYFTEFDKNHQSWLMQRSSEKINKTLGVVPSVFVTPYNMFNNDTFVALKENNMRYISANKTMDPPPYFLHSSTYYRFPVLPLTGNLNDDDTYWFGSTHNQTYAQIMDSLLNYGFAVVMMHPMEYAVRHDLNFTNKVDSNQIQELELLIDKVQSSGLKIVTISEIPENANTQQKVPEWVKSIFVWYEDGKISAEEVINAIEFLTKKGIIVTQYQDQIPD